MLGCIEQCSKCGDEKVQKALHCCAGFLFLRYLTLKKKVKYQNRQCLKVCGKSTEQVAAEECLQ